MLVAKFEIDAHKLRSYRFLIANALMRCPSVQILKMATRLRTVIGTALLIAVCVGTQLIAGCSPKEDSSTGVVPTKLVRTPAEQYAALASGAKGISIGPKVSDYTVFVMFDPQCLHCARLWEESKSLTGTIKFIWVPVNFFEGNSKAQSALLLSSTSPMEDMDRVMSSVLKRSASTAAQEVVPPNLEASIKSNTDLINRFRALAVPYVVARNQTTSDYVARQGGMSREMLKKFLGVGSR
jgi:thiol:disulfide interchange protein DsbG